jgi:endonuclease-3
LAKPEPPFPIHRFLSRVRKENRKWRRPVVAHYAQTPFTVLISCLLSLRTQDKTTDAASGRIFALARTPKAMRKLSVKTIERAIYPVCFYRNKAKSIHAICKILLEKYEDHVPRTIEALVELPGVGRKTANLVMTEGHKLPGICVDVHVHRITNRWGYVRTQMPDETETVLRKILPPRYWIGINEWLVTYGQNLCKPVSPHCSQCVLALRCPRKGVQSWR